MDWYQITAKFTADHLIVPELSMALILAVTDYYNLAVNQMIQLLVLLLSLKHYKL